MDVWSLDPNDSKGMVREKGEFMLGLCEQCIGCLLYTSAIFYYVWLEVQPAKRNFETVLKLLGEAEVTEQGKACLLYTSEQSFRLLMLMESLLRAGHQRQERLI